MTGTSSTACNTHKKKQVSCITSIPTRWVGPISLKGNQGAYTVHVPLAAYETPLWPSVKRGALVTARAGGISTTVLKDSMTRSILLETFSASTAQLIASTLLHSYSSYKATCEATSRFLCINNIHPHIVSSLLFIRLEATTGDASGHNMITKAADAFLRRICIEFPSVRQLSVSGNLCTDKKVSAVNTLLGRGKSVIAEVLISHHLCTKYLRTTPQILAELNIKKNFIGSIIAGSIESANAHYANMLAAIYLATGQDVANIVEGSQGVTHCEERAGNLYFSVSLPNIIVGSIGNGKELPDSQNILKELGCLPSQHMNSGAASCRLAEIIAATVLCGELSLLGAQANPGELVQTHLALERSIQQ